MEDASICPICLRPVPPDVPQSRHHLVPKLKGGAKGPVVLLHDICHRMIHRTFTEAQLARDYADPAALRAHPAIARFAAWVARRPPGFRAPMPGRRRRQGVRRRPGTGL